MKNSIMKKNGDHYNIYLKYIIMNYENYLFNLEKNYKSFPEQKKFISSFKFYFVFIQ